LDELAESENPTRTLLAGALDGPPWVVNAWLELLKATGLRLRKDGAQTAADLGALMGRLYGMAALFSDEIEPGPESRKELAALEAIQEIRGVDVEKAKRVVKDVERYVDVVRATVKRSVLLALDQPYAESFAFLRAFTKAAKMGGDDLSSARGMRRYTKVIWCLLCIRGALHQVGSVGELYRKLKQTKLAKDLGDLKSFEKLCQQLGLKLRPRGRPSQRPRNSEQTRSENGGITPAQPVVPEKDHENAGRREGVGAETGPHSS